jgi:hypothetical protein
VGTESDLLRVVTCHFHRCHATHKTVAMGVLLWWSEKLYGDVFLMLTRTNYSEWSLVKRVNL